MLNFTSLKLKILLCKGYSQENEKTSQKLGETFAKDTSDKELLTKYTKNLKIQQEKTRF